MLLPAQWGVGQELIFRCMDVDVIYDVHRNLSAPQKKFPTEMDSRRKAGRKVGKKNIGNSSLGEEESRDTRVTAVEQCYPAGMSFMVAEIASACLNPIIRFWF